MLTISYRLQSVFLRHFPDEAEREGGGRLGSCD